jgi:DNA modification methylase
MTNTLYYGDNLRILRDHIGSESVDLVYLDPPFNSNATYNVLFRSPTGEQSQAQIEAFEDSWHWNETAEHAFDDVVKSGNSDAAEMLRAMRSFLGENDMMAYLAMMAVRLLELHRVLKPTGSLYLHCDPTASHYLKILLDAVFGPQRFRNEIIWKRSSSHADTKQGMRRAGRIHDIIFFYTKSDDYTWNSVFTPYDESYIEGSYKFVDDKGRRYREGDLTAAKPGGDVSYDWRVKRRVKFNDRWVADVGDEYLKPKPGWEYLAVQPYSGRFWAYSKENMLKMWEAGQIIHRSTGFPQFKRYLDEQPGVPLQDIWLDINPLVGGEGERERLGYPTQKPLALLERIISASSNEGDVVLDPFCGCGTTVHAAQKLNRRWIGIDITHLAISLIRRRLIDAFPQAEFEVHGVPQDIGGAEELAKKDPHQFQLWVLSMIEAQPYKSGKKGADRGVDGYLYFKPDGKVTEKAIVSVKGGAHVSDTMVKDLITTVEHEGAKMGVFVTLTPPTQPMKTRAVSAGFYETEYGQYPKIQILTIEDLFKGVRPHMPWIDPSVFKKAKREQTEKQDKLDL